MKRATPRIVRSRERHEEQVEPLWPPFVSMLAVGGLYTALPPSRLGGAPRWLPVTIVAMLAVPIFILHHRHNHFLGQVLGYILNSLVTVALIVSLGFLIEQVTEHHVTPAQLLRSAAALWVSNFLVFASWYWRLDGGGPHKRAKTVGHTDGAFLFPQMTMHPEAKSAAGEEEWEPNFIDYLFLAFNTSTAFSPTDTAFLSQRAKVLMMVQAILSLLILAVLVSRAVNTLVAA